MRGRFDQGLRAIRLGTARVRILPDVDAQRRKQYALAERIASASFNWEHSPHHWQRSFSTALREIQQFDKEFEEVRP